MKFFILFGSLHAWEGTDYSTVAIIFWDGREFSLNYLGQIDGHDRNMK